MKKYLIILATILALILTACSVSPITPSSPTDSTTQQGSGSSPSPDVDVDNGEQGAEGGDSGSEENGSTTVDKKFPGTFDAQTLCVHTFLDNTCTECETRYNGFIFSTFGDNVIVYTNDMQNPYGISLDYYGSDVNAIFYTPNISGYDDPYKNATKYNFYTDDYTAAWCYEDSYYRTKHHLLSGDCTPQSHSPGTLALEGDDGLVEITTATYVLSPAGSFLGYITNDLNGQSQIIYYGGGYTALDEVAAYLLAFGEAPCNNDYSKSSSGKSQAVADWGAYGRVNVGNFRNTGTSTEPKLPGTGSYLETDFGTVGGFTVGGRTQSAYNTGNGITRGTVRFVFTPITSKKRIDDRYVFYTYNHYNDFQQYLNYNGGWGVRFGNESAGNEYNQAGKTPTPYPQVSLFSYYDLLS